MRKKEIYMRKEVREEEKGERERRERYAEREMSKKEILKMREREREDTHPLSFFGNVAEKRRVCRSGLMLERIDRTCGSNPI